MNNLWVHTDLRVEGVRYDRSRGFRVFEAALSEDYRSSPFHRYIVPLFCLSTLVVVPFLVALLLMNLGGTAQVAHSFVEINFPSIEKAIYGSGSAKALVLSRLTQLERQEVAGQAQFIAEIISKTKAAPNAEKLSRIIVAESLDAGVDPLFVASIIQTESMFKNDALSHKGASGLMQIMPDTGKFTARLTSTPWVGTWRLRDATYNVKLGIAYFKYLEDMFSGDKRKALIAYNWGPGNVINSLKARKAAPLSTRQYAGTIIARHRMWSEQLADRKASFKFLDAEKILG